GLTPVEVGSDLAGSLRLPPHFCGVYGLKTTEHRVPATGFVRPLPGVPRTLRVLAALGPMARCLDDLDLVLRVIAGPDGWDADVPPVPLRERRPVQPAELRLAVTTGLPGAPVAPALRGAVERVAAAASDAGAAVTEVLPGVDWSVQGLFGALVETLTGLFDPAAELDEQ